MTSSDPSCALRARAVGDGTVRVVTRNLSFDVDKQLGIDPAAELPAALDLLVGALASDLLLGLGREAQRAGVSLHDTELRLEARLDNPLVALGVIGETGSAGLSSVTGTLFVSADTDQATLDALWAQACVHAPVYATLKSVASIHITLRLVP